MNAAEVRMRLEIDLEAKHVLAGEILAKLGAQHAALDGIRQIGENPALDRPIRAIVAGENHAGQEVWAVLQREGNHGIFQLEVRHLDVLLVAIIFDLVNDGVPKATTEAGDALLKVIDMVMTFDDDVLDLAPVLARLEARWADMKLAVPWP